MGILLPISNYFHWRRHRVHSQIFPDIVILLNIQGDSIITMPVIHNVSYCNFHNKHYTYLILF